MSAVSIRLSVTAIIAILGMTACSTVDKLNPFSSSSSGGKPTELANIKSTAQVATVWKASVGSAGEYIFSPAIVGRSVYSADRKGNVVRFDDGKQVWRSGVGQGLSGGVGSDGSLTVVGTDKGEVIAMEAVNGKVKWRARVSSEVLAAPVVSDDIVVVRSGDSRIFCFDVTDGKRRWVYQRSTPALSLRSNVGVVVSGPVILAGFPGGKLVAIARNNGAALWELSIALPKGATELERVADVTSLPVISGSVVCAAAFQGRVSCIDAGKGTMLWSREMSSSAGVDMDNLHVYVTDDKGVIWALDRTSGATVWKQDKLSLRGLTKPIAVDSHVAVADFEGMVHLLRKSDGEFAARAKTDGTRVQAEPQSYGNGFLLQTSGGGIFALEAK